VDYNDTHEANLRRLKKKNLGILNSHLLTHCSDEFLRQSVNMDTDNEVFSELLRRELLKQGSSDE